MAIYIGGKSPTTITNLITNGSFENTGWTGGTYDTSVKKFGSHSYKLTGTTSVGEVMASISGTTIPIVNGHIYYASVWGYQPSGSPRAMQCYFPVAEPHMGNLSSVVGTWTKYSWWAVRNFTSGNVDLRFDFDNNFSTDVMYFDGAVLIDLTATFGAGTEPSKEWCDANIGYFEGSRQIMNPSSASFANYEVRQIYRGLGGVNREIKEVYRGLSGVNRKVFSSAPPKPAGALYWLGDECTSLTGGWSKGGYTRGNGVLTKNVDNMTLYTNTDPNQTVSVLTNNAINLSSYSVIKFEVTCSGYGSNWSVASIENSRATVGSVPTHVASVGLEDISNIRKVFSIDISSINASKYVNVTNDTGYTVTHTIVIHKVWLE